MVVYFLKPILLLIFSKIRSYIHVFENYIKAVFNCLRFFLACSVALAVEEHAYTPFLPITDNKTWQATFCDRR